MAAFTTSANVLQLLPARTRCGLAFDQLSAAQTHQTCVIGNQDTAFFWKSHHRAAKVVPWTVCWSNGPHHIAMSLKASAGAWSAALCFFDRLPQVVARAAIATCFKPLVAMFASGPWIELANTPSSFAQGGADAVGVNQKTGETFECEFAFSDPAAAEFFSTSLHNAGRCVAVPHVSVACEMHLRRLRIALPQIQTLCVGDVLIGGGAYAGFALNTCGNTNAAKATRAVLYTAFPRRSLAVVALSQDCWRVVSLNQSFSSESPMQDEEFLFDDGEHPEDEGGTDLTAQGLDLADLKVGVDIVVCRLSMTVAAIEALRPGSALELSSGLDDSSIEIRVGGQRFATGTLIALDGRLAVQIKAVRPAPPKNLHN
jgi:flagellar motor switch/type III secretory pathway protein FliN